jgi:tetratricopeptide (TPR) repeat protein
VAELEAASNHPEQAAKRLAQQFEAAPRRKGLEEIERLLGEGKLPEVVERLEQLVKSLPALRQEGLVEQLKGLVHSGNKDAAVARVKRFIEVGKKLDEQMLIGETLAAAQLLEKIGRNDEAQQYFESYYRHSPDPMAVMPYCRFLAQRGEIDKALDLCEKSRLASRAEMLAQAGVSVLTESNPTPAQIQRVEKWVQGAPTNAGILAQADLYLMQKRLKEAEKIYRFVLTSDQGNIVALNNLAWLLAFDKRDSDEALGFINKAIEVAGHRAELVDTRGNVYLSANKTKEAINDLKDAVADSGAAAMYLHLARAYLQDGNRALAAETWNEGQRHGLDPMKLHPLDRSVFDQVKPQIAQATSTDIGGETKRR